MTTETKQAPIIQVTCGANTLELEATEQLTVGQLRKQLEEALNVSSEHSALVGGKQVGDTTYLRPGDQVEFVRQTGTKG